ncbi:transglycosylase SLT domain-containing protein [Pseudoduganella sp. RAF19]|uniref:transglycosylase SLT domain-containing protein n=1 Tax=Pseudoduganella sp. RAF19 TaxID=3233052 RepID=UPI003F9DF16E
MLRLLVLCYLLSASLAQAATIPRECLQYRRDLVRNSRQVFGMDAPVATLAGQLAQESACRTDAKSAYASGLAQFTPDTASWISGLFPELANNQPTNPVWALRAQSRYMHRLMTQEAGETECDRMWFALWDYNGGAGWTRRDRRAAAAAGRNPARHDDVEPFNAGRAPAMFRENRNYPKAIIGRWQPLFIAAGWGAGSCV